MDSQTPTTFPQEVTFTDESFESWMASVTNAQMYDNNDLGWPSGSAVDNADPAPPSYMTGPNATLHLYQQVSSGGEHWGQGMHDSLGFDTDQGIAQAGSSTLGAAQMLESQYFPEVQQHHESLAHSREHPGEVVDYHLAGLTTPESGHAHEGASTSANLRASSQKAPQDGSPLGFQGPPPAPRALRFANFVDAEAAASNRTRPVLVNDDWAGVKASPAQWVRLLVGAFGADYAATPEQVALTEGDLERWLSYQESHVGKADKYGDEKIEAACWLLLKSLIEAHEVGFKQLKYHKTEDTVICSDHVMMVVDALQKYAVIRYDVVRLQRIDELVCCTTSAIHRKLANFRGNANKIARDAENQQTARKAGVNYISVLGDKKRKAPATEDDTADTTTAAGPATTSKRPRTLAPAASSSSELLDDDTTANDQIQPRRVSRKTRKTVPTYTFDFSDDLFPQPQPQ